MTSRRPSTHAPVQPDQPRPGPSVLVVAESDSYLKWGVAAAASIHGVRRLDAVIVASPSVPSESQQRGALLGSPLSAPLAELNPWRIAGLVRQTTPDVVFLAVTGPAAHLITRALATGNPRSSGADARAVVRPVIVAGLPGIALPATDRAWLSRGGVDLFVVSSRREQAEHTQVRNRTGATGEIGLSRLPFLDPTPPASDPAQADGPGRSSSGKGASGGPAATPRTEVVFATQGKVPIARGERLDVLRALADLADRRPDLRVVVKSRGRLGEFHTHYEPYPYEELWAELTAGDQRRAPDLLHFSADPMVDHLDRAVALVTISSTAALEAMARGIPVLLLDTFGVGSDLINEAFVGCGCLGGLDRLRAGDFPTADPLWMRENYFHDPAQSTWLDELDRLLAAAREGTLPTVRDRLAAVEPGFRKSRSFWRRRLLDPLRSTGIGRDLARKVNGWRIRSH